MTGYAYAFTGYSAVYLASAILSAGAAVYAFRYRVSTGARWLFWMLCATMTWSLAEALDFSAFTLSAHKLAGQLSYLGATTAPVLFFLFALEYGGTVRRVPGWMAALFITPSVLSIVAASTNQWHHLVWLGFVVDPQRPFLITYEHGPVYWAITMYCLALALMASVILIGLATRARGIYRKQSIAVVLAAVVPWVAELGYSIAPTSRLGLDPAVTLVVTGTILAVTMSRFRLLDLIPVSREELVDEMADGVLVLDQEARVLEMNQAAARLLGLPSVPPVGTPAAEMFADWPVPHVDQLSAVQPGGSAMLRCPSGIDLGVDRSALHADEKGQRRDLFMLRDMTGQAEAERALHQAYADLQVRVVEIEGLQHELRDQATRDHLTGLHNRRYLAETLERELGRAQREHYPVAFLMLDVDHFKDINDTCGHLVGDEVLRIIGAEMRAKTRLGDISCRYGGDEFVAVLPNSTLTDSRNRAERLRIALREKMAVAVGDRCAPTISAGLASFPQHGATAEDLLVAVDTAVYAAKSSGRNRVAVAVSASDAMQSRLSRSAS